MLKRIGGLWDPGLGVAAVVLFAGLALFRLGPGVPADEESARYWVLARSVAEGSGYRDLAHPDRPVSGEALPLYPVVLAPLVRLGVGPAGARAVSVLLASCALALFWLFMRRRSGIEPAGAVAVALAFNPAWGAAAVTLTPDALLLFWIGLALYATSRWKEGPRWFAVALAAGVLAFLTASAGVAVLLALAVAVGVRRQGRRLAWVIATATLVSAAWLIWRCGVAGEVACVPWAYVDAGHPEWGILGPELLIQRVMGNASRYAVRLFPASLVGVSAGPGWGIALVVTAALALLALIGWVRSLRAMRVSESLLGCWVIFALFAPTSWGSVRTLAPILPLALWYAAEGGRGVLSLFDLPVPRVADVLGGAALAALALPHSVDMIATNQRCLRSVRTGDPRACYDESWRGFFEVAEWARDRTPRDAVVIGGHPRLFFWLSDRRTLPYAGSDEAQDLWQIMEEKGVRYIVLDPVDSETRRRLVTVVRGDAQRVQVAHRAGNPATTLLRVLERGESAREGR